MARPMRFERVETGGRPTPGERGFALVVVLLALVGATALASAGYLLSNADYRINQSHRAATQAFYVADAGLERYLGSGRIWPDTQVYSHQEGRAWVWADTLMAVSPEADLFRITALGRHAPAEGGVSARKLSTLVIRKAADFSTNAAITAPPGLNKNGVAGSVSGFDTANAADCGLPAQQDKAGLMVPPDGLKMSGGGSGKGESGSEYPGFEGDPPVDDTQPSEVLLASTGIPWASMLSGEYAEADYVVSEDGYPDFDADVASDEWPYIVVDQSEFRVNPTYSGRGLLAVSGDLYLDGNFQWDGIILVGGQLTSNGNERVHGSVVTGLNMMLDPSSDPGEVHLGNGTWEYAYNSCNVLSALKGAGVPVEEPGTWSESI